MGPRNGERWIVRKNIERFKTQLETEQDESRRRELRRLLDAERKKLKALNNGG